MAGTKALTVTVSLDVEEEGLFRGNYSRLNPSLRNISRLESLEPFLERGVKPTLFCAWPVLQDRKALKILDRLRCRHEIEIGAHLHFWNTPPLLEGPDPAIKPVYHKVATARVNPAILKAKLSKLISAANDFNSGQTASFRMGRWDLRGIHWPMLMSCGLKCDASVRPLHFGRQADKPDHFDAPQDPYWLENQFGSILEIPLTVTSWLPFFSRLKKNWICAALIKSAFKSGGALPLLAVEHPLPVLKLVTLLHASGGGQNISLSWHSSEMMPGGAPHMPDSAAVKKFLTKMAAYFEWLEKKFMVRYETMSGLRSGMGAPGRHEAAARGDWSFPPEEIFAEADSWLGFP